jgi:hypothetical protein
MIMAKQKPKRSAPENRKPTKGVRIRLALFDAALALGKRNETSATTEINRAVRELLAREGLWPPKKDE